MAASAIPGPDAQALIYMQNFASVMTANPATYQQSSADAAAVSGAVNGFDVALTVATEPSTRTKVTVALKDAARVSAEQIVRQYYQLIKFNAGISNADKIAIGVRPVNDSRNPINAPATSPLLNVVAATPGAQTLRYADSLTPDSKAKPFGATSIQLYVAIAASGVVDPSAAQFYGAFTKNPVGIAFDAADDGKMATYFARWASRRGDTGPWSLPVAMRIAA